MASRGVCFDVRPLGERNNRIFKEVERDNNDVLFSSLVRSYFAWSAPSFRGVPSCGLSFFFHALVFFYFFNESWLFIPPKKVKCPNL